MAEEAVQTVKDKACDEEVKRRIAEALLKHCAADDHLDALAAALHSAPWEACKEVSPLRLRRLTWVGVPHHD